MVIKNTIVLGTIYAIVAHNYRQYKHNDHTQPLQAIVKTQLNRLKGNSG